MFDLVRRNWFILLATAALLVAEVVLLHPKTLFLQVALLTSVIALGIVHHRSRDPIVLLYATGIVVAGLGYCYLALTQASFFEAHDHTGFWADFNKRPFVFAYVILAAFGVFHWAVIGLREHGWSITVDRLSEVRPAPRDRWLSSVAGALVIGALAWWCLCLPALRPLAPGDNPLAMPFYNIHVAVHLGTFEQIRLGAQPYVEAESQYGIGNQLLLYALTEWESFSQHGFHIVNVWLNAAMVVIFFVVMQQALGIRWALICLVGWLLCPSPADVMDFTGWAVFTRWLAVPLIAVPMSLVLANAASARALSWKMGLLGVVWGIGSFLSQENLTGGLVVLVFLLGLWMPVSGMSLFSLGRCAAIFLSSGIIVFLAGVSSTAGLSRLADVWRIATAKSSLVTAGFTNAIWAPGLDSGVTFSKVIDHLSTLLRDDPVETAHFLQTYGGAVLLPLLLMLLARFMTRRWRTVDSGQKILVSRFTGVVVGAFVLHLFTLFRSDSQHLAGPSFLLPLVVLMLPVFAWRCLDRGVLRNVLLAVSVIAIVVLPVAARTEVARKVARIGDPVLDTEMAWDDARRVHLLSEPRPGMVGRYSPLPEHAAVFRGHADFTASVEIVERLHTLLGDRPVELGAYKVNDLIFSPEPFYFLGTFRSLSGITSPSNSLWLGSDEDKWIDKVITTRGACVFLPSNYKSRLVDAWQQATAGSTVDRPVAGRDFYGTLSCRD